MDIHLSMQFPWTMDLYSSVFRPGIDITMHVELIIQPALTLINNTP